jgi:nucleotide-binding universal stress UspA family protein
MKKILVPCDFSDSAVQAFKFAVEIANQSNGEIMLLNVIELPVMHDTVLMPTLSFEEAFLKDMKANAEKNFSKMRDKWAKEGPKVTTFIEYGPTAHTIREFTTEKQADLVVMGTKGATGVKEFFVGSNTEKIVRWSRVPVIAVKKSVKASSIKNIVFANTLEDSKEQEVLTLKVKALQSFFKAKLHIVYINTPGNFKRDVVTHKQLDAFAKRFMLKDFTLNVYNATDQEMGLRDFVGEVGADLVAIATHGRRGLSHILSGSVAEDVVNHIDCPIWTCVEK